MKIPKQEKLPKQPFFQPNKRDFIFSAIIMGIATFLSGIFHALTHGNITNISLIYVFFVIVIARRTKGYFYGLLCSIISVIFINYFFTYPYFGMNFLLTNYPLTFTVILIISALTSATTTKKNYQATMLAENQKKLAEADKETMRANLLRAVSHDLRTPLTSIIGTANTYIANYAFYDDEEKLRLIQNINDDANWLLNMTENLLTVTRIQNNNQKVNTTLEVVEEVLAEAVTRFKKRYPEEDVRVSIPEEFLMIPMDAVLIEQVIINLLENAIVHGNSKIAPLLFVEADDTKVTFHIQDYGTGIKEDRIANLFDGNASVPTTSNLRKGMGLGLSICKTILLAHGGDISAKNHESGADFYFTLPKEETNHEIQV